MAKHEGFLYRFILTWIMFLNIYRCIAYYKSMDHVSKHISMYRIYIVCIAYYKSMDHVSKHILMYRISYV